jgi:hypothetical protein
MILDPLSRKIGMGEDNWSTNRTSYRGCVKIIASAR